jgi:phosphoserine aminotransferase
MKPELRPQNPRFSSGPCTKRPGWTLAALENVLHGRSHRAAECKAKINEVCDRMRALLGLPDDYLIALVPGSDTGAFEMAMWSLLGERGVDVAAWENFGSQWIVDVVKQLRIDDHRVFEAPYGELPDLAAIDCDRDVVFTWNGTAAGVCVPNGDWIPADRKGLTICDATSGIFAMDLDWPKLDAVTFSFQKVLGGEAAHGVIVLSPRAVERIESYTPPWPMPKVFRLKKGDKLNREIFNGSTINTVSMLVIEDALDALTWAESLGLDGMIKRSRDNLAVVEAWVEKSDWAEFLAKDPATRSSTAICLSVADAWFTGLDEDSQRALIKNIMALLQDEGVALDFGAYPLAPPGLRLWGGSTVEASDLEAVLPWLDWAYGEVKSAQQAAA